MERKKFLATTLAALPLLAFPRLKVKGTNATKPFVIRAGKSRTGRSMKYKGKHPNDIIISKNDTEGALSAFMFTGLGKVGPSLHVHYNQDEFFYVVEGKYKFMVGNENIELIKGDTIFLPRNLPHTWIQLTHKGKLFYAVSPAGTLEDFFIEMDGLKKPPTSEEFEAIHLKYGMKVIGPGLKP